MVKRTSRRQRVASESTFLDVGGGNSDIRDQSLCFSPNSLNTFPETTAPFLKTRKKNSESQHRALGVTRHNCAKQMCSHEISNVIICYHLLFMNTAPSVNCVAFVLGCFMFMFTGLCLADRFSETILNTLVDCLERETADHLSV